MKKSISLTMNDEELMDLQRILPDDDKEAALRFLKIYIDKQIKAAISGEGHGKPWYELPVRGTIHKPVIIMESHRGIK